MKKKQQQKTCVKKIDCESQTSSALPFSLVKYCWSNSWNKYCEKKKRARWANW